DPARGRGRLKCRRRATALANTKNAAGVVRDADRHQAGAGQAGEVLRQLWRWVRQRPRHRHLRQDRRRRALGIWRGSLILQPGRRYSASGVGLSAGGATPNEFAVMQVIEKLPVAATSATRLSRPMV